MRKDQTFGLDIESTAVKAVQLRRTDDGYELISAARVPCPRPTGQAEEITLDEAAQTIGECLRASRIRSRLAVSGVSGEYAQIHPIQFPHLSEEEYQQAVQLEAEQVSPIDSSDCVVVHDRWAGASDQVEDEGAGIMVTASRQASQRICSAIESAGLRCTMLDVDALAILNCYTETHRVSDESRVALLYLAEHHVHMIVLDGAALPFFRDFPYGSQEILKEMAQEAEDSPEALREFLFRDGTVAEQGVNLTFSLARASHQLVSDVMETLRFYYIQHKGSDIEHLYVCGEFAMVNNFVPMLDAHLPVEVSLWNPLESFKSKMPRETHAQAMHHGPCYVVAAGLAMREL